MHEEVSALQLETERITSSQNAVGLVSGADEDIFICFFWCLFTILIRANVDVCLKMFV